MGSPYVYRLCRAASWASLSNREELQVRIYAGLAAQITRVLGESGAPQVRT